MANTLQIRRGAKANLPTLSAGEPGFTTDTHETYIGDGAANHQVSMHDEFNANTVLKADTNDTPTSLTIGEGSILGRITGGSIDALSGSDVMGVLSGTATSSFSMNSQKITSLTDGADPQDAVNKSQLDTAQAGLDSKDSARLATTAGDGNITLSGGAPNTVDSVSLALNDRILVKNQTAPAENGIYTVDTVGTGADGTWTRTLDADTSAEVTSGMYLWVEEGTTNSDRGYVLTTNDPITLDTTGLDFSQFTGAFQLIAGTNLTKSGNTLNVSPQGTGSGLDADTLDGVELANITWTDVAMAETDITQSDVGLANVTNDAQIAKDGSIDFTGDQSMGDNNLLGINLLELKEIATPASPAVGYNKLYSKNDDSLYKLDSDSNEVLMLDANSTIDGGSFI